MELDEVKISEASGWDLIGSALEGAVAEIGRQLAEKLDAKVTESHEPDECVYDTAAALVREWCGLTQDN